MKPFVRVLVLVFAAMVLCIIALAPVEISAAEPEVLTVKNCKDLATLLKVSSEDDPFVKEFAQKYHGKKIEFDGYCWDWANFSSGKTLFTTMIWAGDIDNFETYFAGPKCRVENVSNVSFPQLLNRRNVRIIAKVGNYKDSHTYLMLDLISIKYR
ncbi:MAG: DUF4839 domain-containing protein [Synergistaceae bacterium]|jgi:hypothetical protein|nr:DUF4839 domain-containing protein [Synergistaceae bacterium]